MAALDRIRAEGLTGQAVIAALGEPRRMSPAEAAAARRTGRTAP